VSSPAGDDSTTGSAGTGGGDWRGLAVEELKQLDEAVYAAIADTPTPTLDEPLRQLSNAANYSRLWFGVAGGLALVGGKTGRKAAATGLVCIAATSLIVNQGLKRLAPRSRPNRGGEDVPEERRVRMPDSTSFPSGHSASAFAFATGVAAFIPVLSTPLNFLAAGVAYSRVHTGVHYPGDVIIGSLVGASIGRVVSAIAVSKLD